MTDDIDSGCEARRVGVLGGSFDPPHYGHLALAETARVQLSLARVFFVPAGRPPHKRERDLSSADDRAAMVQAAIADNSAFRLSRVDLERPGPHYTVDTLALLRAQYPDVAAWFFLMGEDSLHDLPYWHDVEGILRQASLAVMPRQGKRVDMAKLGSRISSMKETLIWLDVPLVNFSATDLRRRARESLPLRYLVPSPVDEYIQRRGLYTS